MKTTQNIPPRAFAPLMLEHLPIGVALFDTHDLRLLAANPRYWAHLPLQQPEAVIGLPLAEALPSVAEQGVADLFHTVAEQGVSAHIDVSTTEAGAKRYWNWKLDPVSEQGQVTAVLLTITETTERVVALQYAELARAETLSQTHETMVGEWQRLDYIETILASLRNISEPSALAQAILNAISLCFSPQAIALYSAFIEEETLSLLASSIQQNGQQETAVFPLSIAAESGTSPLHNAMHQRTPQVNKASLHGQQAIPAWFTPALPCIISIPLWGKRCEGVLVLGFAEEEAVTELLISTLSECAPYLAEALAEARLRSDLANEQHRLHVVLDQLPEGIVLVEARTSKIKYVNPSAARLLGFALPQLLGAPLNQSALMAQQTLSRQDEKVVSRWNFALIHALWGKTTTGQELPVIRPDGSEIIVLSSATPVLSEGGLITEAVLVFQDITPLKQLERQKQEFFAVANHELRTPLTTIMGFAELLQMRPTEGSDTLYQYAVASIAHECEHLTRLIHDLLDVTRLEYARLEVKRSYQDLLGLLKALVARFSQTTSTHQFVFTLDGAELTDCLPGWFDPLRIEQIISNLLNNAIKYSPVGKMIEVGVRPHYDIQNKAQDVLLWVKDNGIGIAQEDIPHIFERFYRASKVDRSISGFGIGLYLTRKLVQTHGGRIWVEGQPEQGSTFFVHLPLGMIS